MLYLIGQILFLLLLTAIMSGAMGWLMRSLGHESTNRQLESEWATKLTGMRRARDDYRDRLEQLQANGAEISAATASGEFNDEERAQVAAHVRQLEEEVLAGRERLASLTKKLEGIIDSSAQRESEYNALQEKLETTLEGVRERDQRLEQFAAKTTQAARQQTQNAEQAQRDLEDRTKELEQTIEVQKLHIGELESGPQAEQEQVEHGKLLNVIQAQKKTIASLNHRLGKNGDATPAEAINAGDVGLTEILTEREAAIRGLQERLREYQGQNEQLREFSDEIALLREALKGQDETISTLEKQHAEIASRPDEAAQAELINRLDMRDETIAHLQTQLRQLANEEQTREQDEDRYARMMEVIRAQEETIARLNERLRQPTPAYTPNRTVARATGASTADALSGDLFEDKPATILDAPDGNPDNLKNIHGVGPILESKLNELGIYHYRQIAAFGDEEIAWISTHMSSFPNRIIRDRWIDQAVELESERRVKEG